MAAILANDNFKCIYMNEHDKISIRISLKYALRSPFDNKPASSYIFIQENAFENVVWKTAAICLGLNVLRS